MACHALATLGRLPGFCAGLPAAAGAYLALACALVNVTPLAHANRQLPRVVIAPGAAMAALNPRKPTGLLWPLKLTITTPLLPPAAAINAASVALHTYAPGVTHKALLCGLTVLGSAWGGNGAPATVPVMVVFLIATIFLRLFKKPAPVGLALVILHAAAAGAITLRANNAPTTYVLWRRVHTNVTGGGGY